MLRGRKALRQRNFFSCIKKGLTVEGEAMIKIHLLFKELFCLVEGFDALVSCRRSNVHCSEHKTCRSNPKSLLVHSLSPFEKIFSLHSKHFAGRIFLPGFKR